MILVGHAGHPEVVGTMGRFDASQGGRIHLVETVADAERVARATRPGWRWSRRRPVGRRHGAGHGDPASCASALASPRREDICYATQNRRGRRAAAHPGLRCHRRRRLAVEFELEPPVRDRDCARHPGVPRGWCRRPAPEWFEGCAAVGVTAGLPRRRRWFARSLRGLRLAWRASDRARGRPENVVFGLPPAAQRALALTARSRAYQQRVKSCRGRPHPGLATAGRIEHEPLAQRITRGAVGIARDRRDAEVRRIGLLDQEPILPVRVSEATGRPGGSSSSCVEAFTVGPVREMKALLFRGDREQRVHGFHAVSRCR